MHIYTSHIFTYILQIYYTPTHALHMHASYIKLLRNIRTYVPYTHNVNAQYFSVKKFHNKNIANAFMCVALLLLLLRLRARSKVAFARISICARCIAIFVVMRCFCDFFFLRASNRAAKQTEKRKCSKYNCTPFSHFECIK